jgi:hypothetical protein
MVPLSSQQGELRAVKLIHVSELWSTGIMQSYDKCSTGWWAAASQRLVYNAILFVRQKE